MDKFMRKVSLSLNEMRRNGIGTDVVLVCEEKWFPAHQLILSAASPYLKTKIENQIKDNNSNEIDLSNVNDNTLNSILEFLYLSDPEKFKDKKLNELMEIYKLAHLFQIQELLQFVLELISNQINSENYLIVWNMRIEYDERNDCEDILSFITKHLRTVALKEDFLNLSYDQMKIILKRVDEKQIPTENYLLENVVAWMTKHAARWENVDLFYYLNFDRVTEKFMHGLMEKKKAFFQSTLKKLGSYFKLHVFPKLKTEEEIKNLHQCTESSNINPPLKFFQFGYSFDVNNDEISDIYEAMRIIEVQPYGEKTIQTVLKLPVSVKNVKFCFHSNSLFYFITGKAARLHLIGYDYKSNSVCFNLDMPENINILDSYCSSHKLYIIGQSQVKSKDLTILCVSKNNGDWNISQFSKTVEGEFVACLVLQGYLCILHKIKIVKRKEYTSINNQNKKKCAFTTCFCLTKILKISPIILEKDFPPLKTNLMLDKKFIRVSDRKLYAFVFKDSQCICFEFNPRHNHWNRCDISVSSDAASVKTCYSTKDYGILFCTLNNTLLQFDEKEHSIKPFCVNMLDLDKESRFLKETNLITGKTFIEPQEKYDEDVNDPINVHGTQRVDVGPNFLIVAEDENDDDDDEYDFVVNDHDYYSSDDNCYYNSDDDCW